jgi:hypothetical protein
MHEQFDFSELATLTQDFGAPAIELDISDIEFVIDTDSCEAQLAALSIDFAILSTLNS